MDDLLFPQTGIAAAAAPETPRDWRSVLRMAADRLEQDGWTRHAFYEENEDYGPNEQSGRYSYCAVGAMNVSLGRDADDTDTEDALFEEAYRRLAAFIQAEPNTIDGEETFADTVENWNDAQKNSIVVIKAMREAANVA